MSDRYTLHPVNMTVQVCEESGRVLCSCDDPNDAVLIAAALNEYHERRAGQ
jgi:hypothetical protein